MSPKERAWATPIGNLASPHRALVDGHGRIVVAGGHSLAWWVGADDGWHIPEMEPGLRQMLAESAPVVETLLRIPSGDAISCAYAARDAGTSPGEYVVVEVENRSPVPIALAWVFSADGSDGGAEPVEIDLEDAAVLVGGRPGVWFDRPPARAVTARDSRELAATVTSGAAERGWGGPVGSRPSPVAAAFVFPLAHTARLRAAVPLTGPGAPSALPGPTAVAKGWEAHGGRGARIVLPDVRLGAGVEAARRSLLLAHTGTGAVWGVSRGSWVDIAEVLGAWDRLGFHTESAEVLASLPEGIGARGYLGGETRRRDANGAALVALDDHVRLSGDHALAKPSVELVAAAARWIHGQEPASFTTAEAAWTWRGLTAAADLFELAGERRAAADSITDRARLERAHPGLATVRIEPRRLWDRIRGMVAAASPTWSWAGPGDPTIVPDGQATNVEVDLRLAGRLLKAVRDLLVDEARVNQGTPEGRGDLEMCRCWPATWGTGNLEIHGAPTRFGHLSYAVRWHGERPALLWDLSVLDGLHGPVRLRAPGLDPTWETDEPRGEALLAPAAVIAAEGGASS